MIIQVAAAAPQKPERRWHDKIVSVDEDAIECIKILNGARNDVRLKNKDSLLRISMIRDQPILRCGKQYAVIDGAGTAYIYDESDS